MRRPLATLLLLALSGCEGTIETTVVSCVEDADCSEGVCLEVDGAGQCTLPCRDEQECDGSSTCTFVPTLGGAVTTACTDPIGSGGSGSPCATGSECFTGLCHEGLCVEACRACGGGAVCDAAAIPYDGRFETINVCQWGHDWNRIDLGPVTTPVGGSNPLVFTVPAGIGSFTIVLVDDDGLRVATQRLVSPSGTVLLDVDDADPDINPGFNWPGTAATIVPSTDNPVALVEAGDYSLRVATYDPANWTDLDPVAGAIEEVLILLEPEGEEGGLLDLNLHFAPATGLSADGADEDAFVQAMLGEIDSIYATQARVRLGTVQYSELPTDHDVVDTGDEVRTIVSTFSEPGLRGTSVNIFLVDDVTFTSGYSTGRPGPPGVYGTNGSGIVAELLGNGRDTGVLVAHELGHFLGLYHTSELSGGGRDPISDTPECPGGTVITDCPDYRNLMFPMFPLGGTLTLTDGQRRVLRGNPSLYEIDRPAACLATRTYEVGLPGFATADTANLRDGLQGSCGGGGAPERAHLLRLDQTLDGALEVRVTGHDFAPTVYVARGACDDAAEEFACDSADADTEVVLSVDGANRDAWFIVVDGRDGSGGTFTLEVAEVTP